MKLVLAAVVVMATSSAALADYSHRWVYKGDHVGVEIVNQTTRKLSCNVGAKIQQCFGWRCNEAGRGGATGIIYPGRSHISGWFKGGPVSYRVSCSFVN